MFVDGSRVVFVDGSGVTPGTERCHCDEPGRVCEMPCWQRLGLTAEPCCSDCPPLPCPECDDGGTITVFHPPVDEFGNHESDEIPCPSCQAPAS